MNVRSNTVYLDYNATTPVDPAVAEAMKPYLEEYFGNPSSIHGYGKITKTAVSAARQQVADFLGCKPDEIIFTSGGTESNNYAIKGVAYALRSKGNHIITSSIEHPSVTEVCKYLENQGFMITWLPVDEYGRVAPEDAEDAINDQTILISIMHANNEVGTIQPIKEISRIARERGIVFHTDAAQTCGKIDFRVDEIGIDLLSVAGHKLYGPKGIGALYIRRGTPIEKLIHGADHEMDRRAGTENVIEIVGLGKACEMAVGSRTVEKLRDLLYNGIKEAIPEVKLNGHPVMRLPNTLSLSFPGMDASRLLAEMTGIAASAGAACHADRTDVSAVLTAMGVPMYFAIGTIRFSLGRMTTEEEVKSAVPAIVEAYRRIAGSREPATGSRQPGKEIRLTRFTSSLGCACKIRPQVLEKILQDMPLTSDPSILVDLKTRDDAAVYKINDSMAIVQTIDFIPPIVDDPYQYGAIAAANALSDIYAMGGKPLFALCIVAFPDKLLPAEVLKEIIRGATDKASEAGISIIGGHSLEDTEPKFGLSVTGSIHPDRILANSNAKPGDALILTKPLGTGILATGLKRELISEETQKRMISVMSELNRHACEIMLKYPVNACTDVTGFGLLGHLKEMVGGSMVAAEIFIERIPVLEGVMELLTENIVPGGTRNNLDFVKDVVEWDPAVSDGEKLIFADAQTSGGLLISVPGDLAEQLVRDLHGNTVSEAVIIGKIIQGQSSIVVKSRERKD